MRNKLLFFLLVVLWPFSLSAQDFKIENFHENSRDMAAATSGIRDLNNRPAALIRFAVRDNKFEFEANNGIIKTEWKTGEVWLFVPEGTRRLTVKHPTLGVLRGFELPDAVQSKVTYDANIVITNVIDTQSLITDEAEVTPPVTPPVTQPVTPPVVVTPPTETPSSTTTPSSVIPHPSSTGAHFLLSAGYNVGGLSGLNFGVGGELGMFYVGADYTIGSSKVEGVAIYYNGDFREAYDYSAGRFTLRLGVNAVSEGTIRVVPQAGLCFTSISGSKIGSTASQAQFDKANCTSALIGASLRVMLGDMFCLYATPEFSFAVAPDDSFNTIKEADSSIKSFGEGFGLNIGVMVRF